MCPHAGAPERWLMGKGKAANPNELCGYGRWDARARPGTDGYDESSIRIGGTKRSGLLLLNVIVSAQIKYRYATEATAIRFSRKPMISRDALAMDFRFPMIFLWSASVGSCRECGGGTEWTVVSLRTEASPEVAEILKALGYRLPSRVEPLQSLE